MSRAIDADALMKAMYHRTFETDGDTMWQSGCWIRYRAVEQVIKESPSVTPKQKTGMAVFKSDGEKGFWVCNQCGERVHTWEKYCSECGAKMI